MTIVIVLPFTEICINSTNGIVLDVRRDSRHIHQCMFLCVHYLQYRNFGFGQEEMRDKQVRAAQRTQKHRTRARDVLRSL